MKVPNSNSLKASSNSSSVFMTIGPPQATGSPNSVPETNKKRLSFNEVTFAISPSPKTAHCACKICRPAISTEPSTTYANTVLFLGTKCSNDFSAANSTSKYSMSTAKSSTGPLVPSTTPAITLTFAPLVWTTGICFFCYPSIVGINHLFLCG